MEQVGHGSDEHRLLGAELGVGIDPPHTGRRFQSESTLQDIEIRQDLHDLDV